MERRYDIAGWLFNSSITFPAMLGSVFDLVNLLYLVIVGGLFSFNHEMLCSNLGDMYCCPARLGTRNDAMVFEGMMTPL